MEELSLFLMTFLFMVLIYEIFIVHRTKVLFRKGIQDRLPIEIQYLVTRYHFDLKKINLNTLLQVVAFVSSLDIAVIITLTLLVKNFYWEIGIGFLSTIVSILISYHLVYIIYKKKGRLEK